MPEAETHPALEWALSATGVAAYGALDPPTDEDGLTEEERACIQIRCTAVVRAKWWHARQLAPCWSSPESLRSRR